MEEKKNTQHTHIDIYILLIVLIVLGALLYYFVGMKKTATTVPQPTEQNKTQEQEVDSTEPSGSQPQTMEKAPTVTPAPKPIPHGKTDFFVSVGSNVKGPRMGKGTVDPYDPEQGAKMTITIEANDTTPVQKVAVLVKTDHKTSVEIPLQVVPGTKNWTGVWTVDDSYLYTYQLTIMATSASGTSSVDVLLR